MPNGYSAGLDDDDELGQFPSAASPLTSAGIDPDMVRANPEMLNKLSMPVGGDRKPQVPYANAGTPTAPEPTPPPSAKAAGELGGAGAPTPTDAEGYGMEGLKQASEYAKKAGAAAEAVPTETPADITKLSEQEQQLGTKTPLRDASGKILDQYKPSTGQKIWRGVRGGLVGFLTGGIPGAAVGALEPQDIAGGKAYGAPNKQYDIAEQKRQEQLGTTQTSLDNARKNWEEAVKARQAQAGEYGKVAGLEKDVTAGAAGLEREQNERAKNANETPEAKAREKQLVSQQELESRGQQADRLHLVGQQRTLFMANGKLPDPHQATEREVALAQATKAFVKEHGRQPETLAEFNQITQAVGGTFGKEDTAQDRIDAQNLRAASAAAEKHLKGLQDLQKHSYMLPPEGKDALAQQIKEAQQAYDDIQTQLLGKSPATSGPTLPPVNPGIGAPRPGAAGSMMESIAPGRAAAIAAPAGGPPPAATKPQPSPDGTRIKLKDGTIQVKRNGKFENE